MRRTDRLGRRLGPLVPVVAFSATALAVLSASRLGLALVHLDRVRNVPGAWWLVPIGVRLDLMALAPAMFAPTAAVLAWPDRGRAVLARLVAGYLAAVAAAMTFFEASTPPFLRQYDSRPNQIFLEYLRWPREIVPTVWSEERGAVVVGLAAVVLAAVLAWRTTRQLVLRATWWPGPARLAALPVAALVLVAAARSGLGHRAANISAAAFTDDHLVNELALDSTYALAYAAEHLRHETGPDALYGSLPRAEAIARVRRQTLLPDAAFPRDDLPLLHRQASGSPRMRPLNLVILLEESLGAEYVGSLGGLPLTPELDALAAGGISFTNLYATGTRTARGIEATMTGFLPTPGDAVLKRGLAQSGFFTMARLLRRHGYATDFVYGGESNFDNMRGFLLNNGVGRVLDETAFDASAFRTTWGVSDEDLVRKANATFVAHGDRPFFALVLSTSNHPPYEYPVGRIVAAGARANSAHNAIRYADWSIGEFFRLARREAYFERTVFVVVADHDTRVYGADLVPLDKFHIPAVMVGPGLASRRVDGVASQVDLLPTALDAIGLDAEHPMPGRDLLAVPDGVPGRAVMQYDLANAYRVGDHVVIHQPDRPAEQFTYRNGRLVPEPTEPELVRDALAHLQVAGLLYAERRYRLPEPRAGK
jgi:phosphoglycerol transferase MdoB-like AlkP superfamily enzyme